MPSITYRAYGLIKLKFIYLLARYLQVSIVNNLRLDERRANA